MTFPSVDEPDHLYFMTATIVGWRSLFIEPIYSKLILDSLTWLRSNARMLLFAFVIMPNHVHTIVKPVNLMIGELTQIFGSFTAHAILKQLRLEGRSKLLSYFHNHRRDKRHNYSIWQDIQAENIYSEWFLHQKFEYLHNNPLHHKRYSDIERADYPLSSACYYDRGEDPVIQIDDIWMWNVPNY